MGNPFRYFNSSPEVIRLAVTSEKPGDGPRRYRIVAAKS